MGIIHNISEKIAKLLTPNFQSGLYSCGMFYLVQWDILFQTFVAKMTNQAHNNLQKAESTWLTPKIRIYLTSIKNQSITI